MVEGIDPATIVSTDDVEMLNCRKLIAGVNFIMISLPFKTIPENEPPSITLMSYARSLHARTIAALMAALEAETAIGAVKLLTPVLVAH
jgi:hypothetical protein